MATKIDVSAVTEKELQLILDAYETLFGAVVACNNTLIEKLSRTTGYTDEQAKIVNNWSLFSNRLHDHHALALEHITATVN